MSMNWYAEIVRAYFTRWRPQWYEHIDDPDKFFVEVGEELARQVDDLAAPARRGIPGTGGPAVPSTRPGDRDRPAGTGPARPQAPRTACSAVVRTAATGVEADDGADGLGR